jgi:peptidyl-prolyl cis-trans isomerase D
MFDLFRSRTRSVRILLGALMVVVALSLLTYLIPSYGTGMAGDMVVAEVGKESVHVQDVQKMMQLQLRNRQLPPELIPHFLPQVIEGMITERALALEAERLGFRVSDAELADAIRRTAPGLFQNGQFVGADMYAAMLAQQNVTIAEFERELRRQLLANRLRDVVLQGSIVTPAEIEREYRRRNDKIRVEYAVLAHDKLRPQVQVAPEEIEKHFSANTARYQVPEKRNLAVLILDQDRLAQTVNPGEADLERLYNRERDRFRVPERVKVRHILLKTTGEADKDAALMTRAEELLKQIRGGANFAELAKKNSEDIGSATQGGELGDWVTRGQTVEEFEKVAFTLPLKQTSDVVKTQYGYHIVQVLAREDAHLQTFAQVKSQLATEWKSQRVDEMMQQLADKAAAALQRDPTAAEKIAADHHMQLVRAERLGPDDRVPGVDDSPEFRQAAAFLGKGEVSPAVPLSQTKVAVAAATEVFPARPATLDEVREEVRQTLVQEKLDKLITERSAELHQKTLSMGGDLKKAAQSMGIEVKTSPQFDREGSVEGIGQAGALNEAFSKPVGSVIGPLVIQGGRAVAKLTSRDEADLSKLAEQRDKIREELKSRKARERAALFEAGLRQQLIQDGKIKIHEDVVARLTSSYGRG